MKKKRPIKKWKHCKNPYCRNRCCNGPDWRQRQYRAIAGRSRAKGFGQSAEMKEFHGLATKHALGTTTPQDEKRFLELQEELRKSYAD